MQKICILFLFLSFSLYVHAQEVQPFPCESSPEYQVLNFWLGTWDVYEGEQKVGENRIEAVLHSCSVIENWKDIEGREGKSYFYLDLVTRKWKQVWVTDQGMMKEKILQTMNPDGSVLFEGQVLSRDGKRINDRTTLSRQGEEVRQIIEQSRDAGKTWTVVFDAIYRRR